MENLIKKFLNAPRTHLFRFLGADWNLIPAGWLFPLSFVLGGVVITWFVYSGTISITNRLLFGLVVGLLILLATSLHDVGHIIGASLVSAPTDENSDHADEHVHPVR